MVKYIRTMEFIEDYGTLAKGKAVVKDWNEVLASIASKSAALKASGQVSASVEESTAGTL